MDIKEQFNAVAEEYDKNRRKFIPCFDDYYIGTTGFIASNLAKPKRILDLGAGTGLLSYYWYQHFPDAAYVLVDIADDMLRIAKTRFAGADNVTYQVENYADGLPDGQFDVIVSALSIHHMDDSEKSSLFAQIYDALPAGGVFVNYDQFCADQKVMNDWFNSYWENQIRQSGLTAHDLALWQERKKLDKECSVEREIEMLNRFQTVKCVYAYQKYAVIVAVK